MKSMVRRSSAVGCPRKMNSLIAFHQTDTRCGLGQVAQTASLKQMCFEARGKGRSPTRVGHFLNVLSSHVLLCGRSGFCFCFGVYGVSQCVCRPGSSEKFALWVWGSSGPERDLLREFSFAKTVASCALSFLAICHAPHVANRECAMQRSGMTPQSIPCAHVCGSHARASVSRTPQRELYLLLSLHFPDRRPQMSGDKFPFIYYHCTCLALLQTFSETQHSCRLACQALGAPFTGDCRSPHGHNSL